MLRTSTHQRTGRLTGMAVPPQVTHSPGRIDTHSGRGAIQAKLTVNAPGDEYEQEADRVAETVMRSSQAACSCAGTCPKCRDHAHGQNLEEEAARAPGVVMRMSEGSPGISAPAHHSSAFEGREVWSATEAAGLEVSSRTASEIQSVVGSGTPMSGALRDFFEPRFGQHFGHVRLHTGPTAASTSENLGAAAFTVGSDIFFNSGQFRTDSAAGLGLIAHELTHVVQQQGGSVSRRLIQRALIGHRTLTWDDFMVTRAQGAGDQEGAGIHDNWDVVPSFDPVTTTNRTARKCGRRGEVEVEATSRPDPASFDKPEAQMDQDSSWVIPRYKSDGTPECTQVATNCEGDFDQVARNCQQAASQCQSAFRGGQKSFGMEFDGKRVIANRESDCTTSFQTGCNQVYTGPTRGSARARTRADCKGSFFRQCIADEAAERARLLRHEQGHFDITHVMAKNARESAKAKAATLGPVTKTACGNDAAHDAVRPEYETNVKTVLHNLLLDWQRAKNQAQQDYDGQTTHGEKAGVQRTWETNITAGLTHYTPASAAPPPAPTTPTPTPAPTVTTPPTQAPTNPPTPAPTPRH